MTVATSVAGLGSAGARDAGFLDDAFLSEAPLRPGDRVRLVAASGPGRAASIAYAVEQLSIWGLRPVVGHHAHDVDRQLPYLAGSDDDRRADLVDAWLDPEAQAVICLRGGYGAMRLLDGIDWSAMRGARIGATGRPKLLTGSSDVTALHQAWGAHVGVPTLFSPMPANDVFRDSTFIRADVHRWLMEPWRGRVITGPRAETLVAGEVQGRTFGGNLSLIAASVGAPEFTLPAGGIAILEDIDEDLYRLDNLMIQLQRCGWLRAAAGIVLGSWHNCAPIDEVRALIMHYVGDLGVPVAWELGVGHDPEAPSVPLGATVRLHAHTSEQPRLVVESV
ncbi:S66 peptidase family protein [Pseudoclavibacter sp. 13-3]|uniref:S66 peptidase family protein n=1 Tax=Pseudoclavibacter sp. 13-3 TaxID=2901228 RepID=UPI001E320026|nr:LD-carboxypeptidase [Pseudoclavibacter sp. 13-3]MCD7101274.1 LD-carboxypeptidase [Pseudoclavibacter sp. 13-3]